MLLAKMPSFLFLLWAFLAAAVWWGKLQSPVLFLVVALLTGLGAQSVSSVLWLMWQASNNQFFVASAEETSATAIYVAAFHAIATLCMVGPVYWLLSKRL